MQNDHLDSYRAAVISLRDTIALERSGRRGCRVAPASDDARRRTTLNAGGQDAGGTAVVGGQSTSTVRAARSSALLALDRTACPAFLDAVTRLGCAR